MWGELSFNLIFALSLPILTFEFVLNSESQFPRSLRMSGSRKDISHLFLNRRKLTWTMWMLFLTKEQYVFFIFSQLFEYIHVYLILGLQDSPNLVVERREERPSTPLTMNAFELISTSQGLNLSSLFEKHMVRSVLSANVSLLRIYTNLGCLLLLLSIR